MSAKNVTQHNEPLYIYQYTHTPKIFGLNPFLSGSSDYHNITFPHLPFCVTNQIAIKYGDLMILRPFKILTFVKKKVSYPLFYKRCNFLSFASISFTSFKKTQLYRPVILLPVILLVSFSRLSSSWLSASAWLSDASPSD